MLDQIKTVAQFQCWRLIAGGLLLALPWLVTSCGQGTRDRAALQDSAAERGKVFQAFLDREELRQEADDSSQKFAEVEQEFQRLLEQFEPRKFSRKVELAAFDLAKIQEGDYQLSLMFKVNEALPKSYKIHVHGYVADEHLTELSEDRQSSGFENWQIMPQPPTAEWEPGRYYLVTRKVQAKQLPYRINVMLAIKKGNKWEHLGKTASLGWVIGSDAADAAEDQEEPESATPDKSSVDGK